MLVYNESSRGLSYNYYAVEGRHDEDETTPKKLRILIIVRSHRLTYFI